MTGKDWIVLLVPILCNGVIVFILQKMSEKRYLVLKGKQSYIEALQKNVDAALSLFIKAGREHDDVKQSQYINQFLESYCNIHYYYQQNEQQFGFLKEPMIKLFENHQQIKEIQEALKKDDQDLESWKRLSSLAYNNYKLLQTMQSECVKHRV